MILIDEACASGARKYKACEILMISLRTFERWGKEDGLVDKRQYVQHQPANKLSEEEQKQVLMTANCELYRNLPPSKIVPMLADNGEYIASESSFYRILRAHHQLKNRGHSRPAKHHKPRSFIARSANQVWTWDITYIPSRIKGLYFYLYLIMDIFSRKIVGWSLHEAEHSNYAAALIKQSCLDENISRDQVVLHSDNGSPMKGISMLTMLQDLGVTPSFSRPSVSDDNAYSEALFKTLKYHPTFPKWSKFEGLSAARSWCESFVDWYNHAHLHSALKFVTPHQRHSGEDEGIREQRAAVYESAKERNPERWSKNTRDWSIPHKVYLNPDKKKKTSKTGEGELMAS